MSKKTVRFITISIILVILGYLTLDRMGVFSSEKKTPQSESSSGYSNQPLAIDAIVATAGRLTEKLSVSGTIFPDEEVSVTSEVNGILKRIFFQEGTWVKEGKILAKIDDSELLAQLEKVNLQIELAKQQEGRKKKLLEIGGISQEEYDQALTELNTLKAEASLIAVQISKTEIRAPFSGIIGIRERSQGSYVTPGTKIADLVKINPVKIEFSVPERYGNRINLQAPISFTIEGLTSTFEGNVYTRNTSIDPETRTLLVKAKSPNPTGKLIPGAFASVSMTLSEIDNAILVPTQAVVPEQGSQNIFVIESGKAAKKTVELGIRQEDQIQVISGIQEGDTIITSGLLQMNVGTPVTIKALKES